MRFLSTYSRKHRRHLLCVVTAALLAAGCGESQTAKEGKRAAEKFLQGDAHGAIQKLRPLSEKTDENFVLNNLRLGSAALSISDLG